MIDLQELITRGKFIFNDAPGRLDVFKFVNGKNNTLDIAKKINRRCNNVRRDLDKIRDAGLIQSKIKNGEEVKKDRMLNQVMGEPLVQSVIDVFHGKIVDVEKLD